MELVSFLVAFGIGIALTFFSMLSKSKIFGLFGGIFILVVAISVMSLGMQKDLLTVIVNSTGNVTTTYSTRSMFDEGVFSSANLGLMLLGLSLFIIFSSALGLYEGKNEGTQA